MHVYFINLDRDAERRAFYEANFREFNAGGWGHSRVPAIDKRTVPDGNYGPEMSKGAVGLSLTHRQTVERSLQTDGHAFIAEDDILFGPSSQEVINHCVARTDPAKWDLLFTDICVPRPMDMLKLFAAKKNHPGVISTLDLRQMVFAGTSGVIVNHRSKEKYRRLLHDEALFRKPIDLLIAEYVHGGQLNAICTFPFATSLSPYADSSEIQATAASVENHLWNAYRRAMWVDRRLEDVDANLATAGGGRFDREVQTVSRVVGSLILSSLLKTPASP